MKIPHWDNEPHILRTQQFSAETLLWLVDHAGRFEKAMKQGKKLPQVSEKRLRILKIAFYEASTRTEDTFWVAGVRLKMQVRVLADPNVLSSMVKGESFFEAMSALTADGDLRSADLIVIRHPEEGAAERAATVIDTAISHGQSRRALAVINGGDGAGQHPTQALGDLFTIIRERRCKGDPLDNLTVTLTGDLKDGRTTNSLMYLLGKFGIGRKIHIVISTLAQLYPRPEILEYLSRHGVTYEFEPEFARGLRQADVVYATRHQTERKKGEGKRKRISAKLRALYALRVDHISLLKPKAFIMHPLPINRKPKDAPAEIDEALAWRAIAGDPQLAWCRQNHRHVPMRAALLDLLCARIDENCNR
ncbi:MAG: hypothetical protein WD972_01730 [Candidatus Andersenbacteria bacterium]